MIRSVFFLLFAATLTGCNTIGSASLKKGAEESVSDGYSLGSVGSSSSSSDDDTDEEVEDTGDSADSAEEADTDDSAEEVDSADDTADTGENLVNAKVWIVPQTTWDVSVNNPATANPVFSMWPVANKTRDEWAGYGGSTVVATTSSNAYVADEIAYEPGNILVLSGGWHDGIRSRYFAEASGVVNALEDRVVIEFEDGSWQGYLISGSTPDTAGESGWVSNGGSGGDVYVQTYADTDDHHDR